MADLLNANRPEEISFGQNMTSLTFSFSRALARTWQPGDEIVVTRLDHDANISPWLMAAEDRGVTVRWLDFNPADATMRLDELPGLLNDKTRLLAITAASNAVGSITDLKTAVALAHNPHCVNIEWDTSSLDISVESEGEEENYDTKTGRQTQRKWNQPNSPT